MKYVESFLKEVAISQEPLRKEPAKPAKGAFDGFAGALRHESARRWGMQPERPSDLDRGFTEDSDWDDEMDPKR